MTKEIIPTTSSTGPIIPAGQPTALSPEQIEFTNMYFECGMDTNRTAMALSIPLNKAVEIVKSPAVSTYISTLILE